MLDVDTVIPLGLISNELISNALKHAFNESLSGKIEYELEIYN
jgi:two-component sensor histidine kinase